MLSVTSVIVYASFMLSLYFTIFWLLGLFENGGIKDEDKECKNTPSVTVAVPAYNESGTIEKTVESLINLDYPREKIEIIIVNDGSKDNTEKIVKKIISENKDYDIKLINQKNSGKGAALNNALRRAKGEFFICLDADSMVKEDVLRKMIPEFENPDVAIVLPFMKVKNPKKLLEKIQWHEYILNFFYKKLMADLDCVHVSPGPFSMYRKKVLEDLGSFKEDNLTEDLEIALRAQKHNYKIVQLLSAEVYTYAPKTLKAFYKQRNRWYKGTMLNLLSYRNLLFNKKYGDFGIMHLPSVMISGILVLFLVMVTLFKFVIEPLYQKIYDLSFVNYNIMPFVKQGMENFQVLDFSVVNIFFGIVSFIIFLRFLILANNYAEEKTFKHGIIVIPIYLLFYSILMSGVWFGVLFGLIIGKKQKW